MIGIHGTGSGPLGMQAFPCRRVACSTLYGAFQIVALLNSSGLASVFNLLFDTLLLISLVQAEDFAAAAALAFELRQARRLLAVVDAALARGPAAAAAILGALVAPLDAEQLKQCLEFAREWNTHSRHCHAAQATLQAVLRHHSPQARHGG